VLAPGVALCTGATYLYRIHRKCSCPHATRANTQRPAYVLAPWAASVRASVRASVLRLYGPCGEETGQRLLWHLSGGLRSPPPAAQVRIYRHPCLTNAGSCAIISHGRSGGIWVGKSGGIWCGNRPAGLVPPISGIPPSPIFMPSRCEILSHFTP
jgi:hypothetical protein